MKSQTENAITWIKRLAKTNFKQAKHKLGSKKEGFCCLGVGCHIFKIPFDEEEGMSTTFKNKVGLLDDTGEIFNNEPLKEKYRTLTIMNDIEDLSFKAISEILKDNPSSFFKKNVAEGIVRHFKTK